jgi:hypothetical protein
MPSLHGTKVIAVRHDPRQVDRIVAGAAHEVSRQGSELHGRLAHGLDALGIKRHRRCVPDLLQMKREPAGPSG